MTIPNRQHGRIGVSWHNYGYQRFSLNRYWNSLSCFEASPKMASVFTFESVYRSLE